MKKQLQLLFLALIISAQANSQTGAALNFDGANDYVSIGTVIPVNSSYTKEAWIYANASGSNNIISSGSSPFWLSGGVLSAMNNGGTVIQDPTGFLLSQWVHVAVTFDATTSTINVYKNGVLVISGVSGSGYPSDPIRIGDYPSVAGDGFNGSIDEVRIWNVVRTQCEINTYKDCEIPTNATGLLANYHFNQGLNASPNPTETTLMDASGNVNTGTLTNFALTGATSNWLAPGGVISGSITPAVCPVAAALNFDGVNNFVSVNNNALLNFGNTQDFTVEANFKTNFNQANYAGIITKGFTGPFYQLVIVNNHLAAEFTDGSNFLGVANGLEGTTLLNDNTWHHLAMIVNRSTNNIKLLVDGNIEANVTSPFVSGNINNSINMFIGSERTNVAFAKGEIDEVRIWNTARTQCEINTYKNCEIPTNAIGLVANYHFNQGVSASNNSATNLWLML